MALDFVYVKGDIQRCAVACGITNDAGVLEGKPFGGSVKNFYDFLAKREAADKAVIENGGERRGFSVPELPQTIAAVSARIPSGMGIDEKAWFHTVMQDMVVKVDSILAAVRMTENYKQQMAAEKADKAKRKEYAINSLAKSNPFGWDANSQSARDWAEAEWRRKYGVSVELEQLANITRKNFGI